MKAVIESVPAISAVYFALLGSGYDYYSVGKPAELSAKLADFARTSPAEGA